MAGKKKKKKAAGSKQMAEKTLTPGLTKTDSRIHDLTKSIEPIEKALADLGGNYPDHNLEGDCPICLDALPPIWKLQEKRVMGCCGRWCCANCDKERVAAVNRMLEKKGGNNPKGYAAENQLGAHCPLCRQYLLDTAKKEANLLAHAAKNQAWAQYLLAMAHLEGNGDAARPNTYFGLDLLFRAAKQAYPFSLYELGIIYRDGTYGVRKSVSNAKYCFYEAAEHRDERARYQLALLYEQEGEFGKCLDTLKVTAEAGNLEGYNELGTCYMKGRCGIEVSLSTAKDYFEKAADLGLLMARYNLSAVFQDMGNTKMFVETMKMAADAGHIKANYFMGMMHYMGVNGVEKSLPDAAKYLGMAAEQGNEDAIALLSQILGTQAPPPKDVLKALERRGKILPNK